MSSKLPLTNIEAGKWSKHIMLLLAVAIAYFGAARLGLLLAYENTNATPVWPPSGVAFAVLIIFGYRVWPGIFLGAFIANILGFNAHEIPLLQTLPASLMIAAGNTLEGLCGVFLLKKYTQTVNPLHTTKDLFRFMAIIPLMCAVSSTIGTCSLILFNIAPLKIYWTVWLTWWMGDIAGVVVLTSLIISWWKAGVKTETKKIAESALVYVFIFILAKSIFNGSLPISYLLIPFLLWAAFRFGHREVATAVTITTSIAVWETIHGRGPFAVASVNESLILLLSFICIVNVTILAMFAALSDLKLSEAALKKANDGLEEKIARRTQELVNINHALGLSEKKFFKAFHLSPIGMGISQIFDGKFIEVNESFLKIFNFQREELIGHSAVELGIVDPNVRGEIINILKEQGCIKNYESSYLKPSGEILHFLLSIEMLELRNIPCSLFLLYDITDRKKNEEALKKAKDVSEQSRIEKERFLANMSHEIRTPMNAILGFTDLMLQTKLDENQNEYIESVKNAGENLLSVINDILDFSKIESGKLTIENQPFNITEMLKKLYNLLKINAAKKGLGFHFNIDANLPEFISGDMVRLNQVMVNLIGNAMKFTKKGEVTVSAKKIEENNNSCKILFKVIDTGIGIPLEKTEEIFKRFTQANNEIHSEFGGTGLGLSISKNLLELMGSDLKLISEPGKGSEFSFLLNFPKVEKNIIDKKVNSVVPAKLVESLKILVFEDNFLNQKLVTNLLSKFNFQFEIAENGKMGLEKLKTNSFDLILMDLQMPGVDGYQATSHIRNEMKSNIPIIAMTAHSLLGEKEKCISHGMNDYLSKPFKQDELFEKICNLAFSDSKKIKIENKTDGVNIQPHSKINFEYLKELSEGNNAFEKEMMELFINTVPVQADALEVAIKLKDCTKIKSIIHNLKNSFLIVGISDCLLLLKIIDDAAKQNSIGEKEITAFEDLKTKLVHYYDELNQLLCQS